MRDTYRKETIYMKKINWNFIWNVVNGAAVIYLMLLALMYLAACILTGFADMASNCNLEDGWLFATMVSVWVVLIKPVGSKVVDQLLKAREIIEEKYTKQKKTVRSTNK